MFVLSDTSARLENASKMKNSIYFECIQKNETFHIDLFRESCFHLRACSPASLDRGTAVFFGRK